MNKVILVGHLGRDPEQKRLDNGQAFCQMSLATTEYGGKDEQGQRKKHTEWHKIVTWGKQAEFCGSYLTKGRQVLVEGRLQTRKWQDKQGQERYTTEVIANQVQAMGAAGQGHGGGGQDYETTPAGGLGEDVPF